MTALVNAASVLFSIQLELGRSGAPGTGATGGSSRRRTGRAVVDLRVRDRLGALTGHLVRVLPGWWLVIPRSGVVPDAAGAPLAIRSTSNAAAEPGEQQTRDGYRGPTHSSTPSAVLDRPK
jgi:hypothetical protein